MTSALITDVDDFIAKIKAEFAPAVAEVESDAVTLEQWVVTNGYPLIMQVMLTTGSCYWHVDRYTLGIFSGIIDFQRRGCAGQNAGSRCGGCSGLNLAKAQLVVAGTVAPNGTSSTGCGLTGISLG